eukprot:TRINITY_DN7311_c0_g2_i1.p1 TRINITY_DN7311_c0_g2~~TRINITY_DN7311_c0_g2_i1.p1  ORF type:complete len:106 (+),score=22.71 TRINITY_DN7311_c0_g2_i1:65-382(+)
MDSKARFHVLCGAKMYRVVVECKSGDFVEVVKKALLIELKSTKFDFRDFDLYDDWLTIYNDPQRFIEISDKMPHGDEFWATLVIPTTNQGERKCWSKAFSNHHFS